MSSSQLPPSLLPDSSEVLESDVLVGGVSLLKLAQDFGTPLFVYDEATLISRLQEAARVLTMVWPLLLNHFSVARWQSWQLPMDSVLM